MKCRPDRMGMVHRVERDHALYIGRCELQHSRNFLDGRLRDPAPRLLYHPERRQQTGLLGGVILEELLETCAGIADEHRCMRSGVRPVASVSHHRSTSPITISTLALIAMTSESKAPSHILGRLERLMNDGGRMRQRTGLLVPSETK